MVDERGYVIDHTHSPLYNDWLLFGYLAPPTRKTDPYAAGSCRLLMGGETSSYRYIETSDTGPSKQALNIITSLQTMRLYKSPISIAIGILRAI